MLNKILLIMCIALITSCSNSGRIQPRGTDDLINETWIMRMNTNPNLWIKQAPPWFVTGRSTFPANASVLFKGIDKAGDIREITVAGEFQVQITGGQGQNNICIVGPRAEKRNISVNVINHKLMISQVGKPTGEMQHVIVNINIHKIRSIENVGPGLVMGRNIISKELNVTASGTGSILLNGNMDIHLLKQTGAGTITAMGVYSQELQMLVQGPGNVNISGRIGVQSILHMGNGIINIIGADSDGLCINAGGNGITHVFGHVNLKQVTADHNSQVYVYWADSKKLDIVTKATSLVGVAGSTANLNVSTCKSSCFLGQYLRSGTAYVSTIEHSHADVAADFKMFATARNQSGILFYGPPSILSKFVYHQATIIPVRDYRRELPNPPFVPYSTEMLRKINHEFS